MVNLKILIIVLSFVTCFGIGNKTGEELHYNETRYVVWSENVQDSFLVYVSYLANPKKKIDNALYYLDADLKSGNYLRKHLKSPNSLQANYIYVGIAHIGDYHIKRRRDFIPPPFDTTGYQDVNFGQAEKFYTFLTKELMPDIETNYKIKPKNQIIGHSLGGLFSIFALTKNDSLFSKFYCLSPSIWINYYDILKNIENNRYDFGKNKTLYLMQGGLEFYNKIKKGNRMLKNTLKKNKNNLKVVSINYPMSGHNGYVNKAIEWILEQ